MSYPYPGDEVEARSLGLPEILAILRRRKWVVVQAFVLVTAISLVVASRARPEFMATSVIQVDTPENQAGVPDGSQPLTPIMTIRKPVRIESQLNVMQSSEFKSRVRRRVGAEAKSARIRYEPDDDVPGVVRITVQSTDVPSALRWADAAAAEYVVYDREQILAQFEGSKRFLTSVVAKAEEDVQRAQDAVVTYRRRTGTSGSPVESEFKTKESFELADEARKSDDELQKLQAQIDIVERRLRLEPPTVDRTEIRPNPDYLEITGRLAKARAERAEKLGTFTLDDPHIIGLDDTIRSLEQDLEGKLPNITSKVPTPNEERLRRETELKDLLEKRDVETRVNPRLKDAASAKTRGVQNYVAWEIENKKLERKFEEATKAHSDYSQALRNLRLLEGTIGGGAKVVEAAEGYAISSATRKVMSAGLGVFMGLLLGLGLALLLEFIDDRIYTSEEAERLTALPTLGYVPLMPGTNGRLLIGQESLSPVTESYRGLRTRLRYSAVDDPVQTIAVTSALSGEGKSVTSSNLAIAMALQGKRVVLIDADLRSPELHRLFQLDPEPGLTSYLAGECALEEVLRPTQVEGLELIPSGPLPPNPAELLDSRRMVSLIETLRQRADAVIIDTPPITLVTDAQVLAGSVDGVVLVIEAGRSRKTAVRQARSLLSFTHVRILGLVLNKVSPRGGGYYYTYYGSNYPKKASRLGRGNGHRSESEAPADGAVIGAPSPPTEDDAGPQLPVRVSDRT